MSKDPVNFLLQEQAGMVVLNPTNEDFDMQYSGVSFTIRSGQKQTLSANAANHILNSFGPRGLCYLQYGADEVKITAEGKRRNENFKRRHVTEFNIRNENRKNMNLGYLPPSEKTRQYAEELGIELVEPYAAKDKDREKMQNQEKEIKELRQKIDMLLDKLTEMQDSNKSEISESEKLQESGGEGPRPRGNPNWRK